MARSFNGSSDVIRCGTISALGGAVNASLVAWVNRSAAGTSVGGGMKGDGTAAHNNKFGFLWWTDDVLYSFAAGASGGTTNTAAQTATGWNHVGLVYNGAHIVEANRLLTFLNGTQLSTGGSGATALGTATEFAFGIDYYSGERFWGGQSAEWGLWSATLTTDEIKSLARGIAPNRVRPTNLFSHECQ